MPRSLVKAETMSGNYENDIRERCLQNGWNVVDLARIMDVAEATAYDIVTGKRQPNFINERKLELIFNVPITEMYKDPYMGITVNIPEKKEEE